MTVSPPVPPIRHTPEGRGHAYRPSLDQRVPVVPIAGDVIEVRALVADGLGEVALEVNLADQVESFPAVPLAMAGDSGGDDDSHLAAAAAAGEQVDGMHPVAVELGPYGPGQPVAYRWVAGAPGTQEWATEWFTLEVGVWLPAEDLLRVQGPEGADQLVDDFATEVLVAGGRAVRARFALRLSDDDHVIGLGERFHALDHRGRSIDTVVFEQYKSQGERTYLPVPFGLVVGGAVGWGFHVDTTRRCWFDIGVADPELLVVEVELDPEDPAVDLALYRGEPAEVIGAFLDDTARPGRVPSWVFRPWASGNEWNTQARVEAEVSRSHDEGVPIGVIVIEAWADEATFTAFRDARYTPREDGKAFGLADFEFPAEGAWPDPVGMVRRLHEQGTKVLLWQIPVLPVDVPDDRLGAEQLAHDRDVLVDNGWAVQEADGSPYHNRGWWFPGALLPDFTSPEATDWWVSRRRYLLEEVGVDGFKTDGGEHAWGDELRYADGTRGAETNNRFANLYARAYHQLLADTGTDGVTFSRAGFTGAGAFPCHWAGDEDSTWEAYRASITAGLSAGVSGVFAWGFDHGGFSGEIPDPELYLRSAAMAMLCPIMQYHSEYNHHRQPSRDRTPWNIAERQDDPSVLSTYRRFTEIRERLVDYLDQQYRAGVETGMPLMRTLALQWPRDKRVWDHPFQYLLGDHLLVAPVTEPGVEDWTVYLPAGEWLDAWDGTPHTGGRTVVVAAPLDRVPAFVTATPEGRAVAALLRGSSQR